MLSMFRVYVHYIITAAEFRPAMVSDVQECTDKEVSLCVLVFAVACMCNDTHDCETTACIFQICGCGQSSGSAVSMFPFHCLFGTSQTQQQGMLHLYLLSYTSLFSLFFALDHNLFHPRVVFNVSFLLPVP